MSDVLEKSRGVSNPLVLLQSAIERGIEPAQLEKLLALQERWEQNRAAEAFATAISRFQSECPVVRKRRTAKITGNGSEWSYQFASYDDVMAAAGPVLAECGIAVSFKTESSDKGMTVNCRIRVGIHFEDHPLTLPIPAMKVNDTQKFGAALSYAKRYALCAALNIVVTDEDDDAATQFENVSEEDIERLNTLIEEKNVDLKRFLAWAQIDKLDQMPKAFLAKALDVLRRKKSGAA